MWIRFDSLEGGTFRLSVRDDGVGLPQDVGRLRPETLGLRLVESLVLQLHGSMELDRKAGTEFVVTFDAISTSGV